MTDIHKDSFEEAVVPPTAPISETQVAGLPEHPTISDDALRACAEQSAAHWERVKADTKSEDLELRLKRLRSRLAERLQACKASVNSSELTPALELLESTRMFDAVLTGTRSAIDDFAEAPYVRVQDRDKLPRIVRLAEEYLAAAKGIWSPESLITYVSAAQHEDALRLAEILLLPASLRLAQLEFILDRADEAFADTSLPRIEDSPFSAPIHSLRRLNQFEWQNILEEMVVFNAILAADPSGAFSQMEEENRDSYRLRVGELAQRSDTSEVETAKATLLLAQEAAEQPVSDSRLARRRSHIGYYLFEEGFPLLAARINYHPALKERIRQTILSRNEDFYIIGILLLSALIIVAFIAPLVPHESFWPVIGALLLALLPATQGASDLFNNVVTAILRPRALPKLDFSKGIPLEESTFVVVPTLLLSESQVRETFQELEARYLSNQDPHLHFGLLTDLPDSEARPLPEDRNTLVELALHITDELNERYRNERGGSFILLHRHRIFNARQGVWMGWERKRGKLLDLNKLLIGEFDSFPVKAGPIEVLKNIRYVITLDSDTQLPRGTAGRMIGAIAHPLNQAIVHPKLRVVTAGYGILQPRVGISVASASRSRLASIYSGETGFDIYTRAVSDVYQDLFGEGIFTGKGIYEASILHAVLDRRFPRNSLLSHDLIEGSYARAGLVTDVEVIDDYPSHYSAHTKRKHRWVRGDWQIVQWMFSLVPDESGKFVTNPISTISRWKIFDNLRRSLVEPVTFVLLLCGWFFLPGGPVYWTIVPLVLLLFPVLVQLLFNLSRALFKFSSTAAGESFRTFFASLGFNVLNLAFLPHQTLLSIDAIARSLVRRFITGQRLLEWETAAQSEVGQKKSSIDRYLQLSPLVALLIAVVLGVTHWRALYAAGPVLLLWALSPAITAWLNSPPRKEAGPLTTADQQFLDEQALLIWRYFSEFGGEENHWLIPDNVEEKALYQVRKLSPTNLGMLFNTRQAAVELGFLTVPEFAHATLQTFATYERLEKQRGHIYNWYDIETLQPIAPLIVSAVDSGNLAASLYALHGGALDLLERSLFQQQAFIALYQMIDRSGSTSDAIPFTKVDDTEALRGNIAWVDNLKITAEATSSRASWVAQEAQRRRANLLQTVVDFTPWLLPRFAPLFRVPQFNAPENNTIAPLQQLPQYARNFQSRLAAFAAATPDQSSTGELVVELQRLTEAAINRIDILVAQVKKVAADSEQHADAMRYDFLLVESRQLLSIGYDGATGELYSSCYDLLASEARIASFLAVAKGDIPQRAWFRLDRTHALINGRASLLSWTGTMFEFLMPTLWMRSFPDTLISRSLESAISIQQEHVRKIPWGISESGFAKTDPQGRYGYQAWGIPDLAMKYGAEDGPVISPYSTFLTLPFSRQKAIANLHRMASLNWIGEYGFYEAADYTGNGTQPEMVRSWMAHHQGMSLLALANLRLGNIFQRWFHANPKVRAAELLLHERPLGRETLRSLEEHSSSLSSNSATAAHENKATA